MLSVITWCFECQPRGLLHRGARPSPGEASVLWNFRVSFYTCLAGHSLLAHFPQVQRGPERGSPTRGPVPRGAELGLTPRKKGSESVLRRGPAAYRDRVHVARAPCTTPGDGIPAAREMGPRQGWARGMWPRSWLQPRTVVGSSIRLRHHCPMLFDFPSPKPQKGG